ncbi:nucleotidyltransferase family protein [Flavihumibacter sp. UBA7668]|uniref:nucleotidyltransferase family protein n=1 Tax=Flavihumibacter sp. UBA7668 TaxID=1946542 RepID=UPI0025BD2877|nr:nucleotidyltransferase family protein [Flavihumibacter sp. UBA7668]
MQGAILLLAAGSSSRMGKPKQLLPHKGRTLLWHAANAAKMAELGEVLIVTGELDVHIRMNLADLNISFVLNPNWAEGMASSIVTGMNYLTNLQPVPDAVLIMVGDQPAVNEGLLKKLWLNWQESGKAIAASSYAQQVGTPAVFAQSLFSELLLLKGDTGAKKLIKKYQDQVSLVPFPDGLLDIDTPQDYEQLKKSSE